MRIAVLGVGLIGGSIGLAARRRLQSEVVGFDPDPGTAERALELGVLDASAPSPAEACEGADVVFCAAPVGRLPELAAAALDACGPDTVVTDVGSTKRDIVVALGGNALLRRGEPLTAEVQRRNVRVAAEALAPLAGQRKGGGLLPGCSGPGFRQLLGHRYRGRGVLQHPRRSGRASGQNRQPDPFENGAPDTQSQLPGEAAGEGKSRVRGFYSNERTFLNQFKIPLATRPGRSQCSAGSVPRINTSSTPSGQPRLATRPD